MGCEHGQAGVLERDERHQDVVLKSPAADLALIGESGLVAMVAVGDQELAGLELDRDRLVNRRIADSPDAVGGAVAVGDLTPGIPERRLEVLPGPAGVEGEDRGEVVVGGAGEPQPVLLRTRLGSFMRPDPFAVGRKAHPGEEAAAGEPRAVWGGVVLLQGPDRGIGIVGERALIGPFRQQLRGVLIRVAAVGIAREVELDDVVGIAPGELGALLVVDHVIRRRDHLRE